MKNLLYIISILITTYLAGILLSWWGLIIPLFMLGFGFNLKFRPTFAYGMLGVFLLWIGLMLFKDSTNDGVLSAQISELFEGIPTIGIAIIFSLIAGLLGGLSAALGRSLRQLIMPSSLPNIQKA